MLGIGAQWGRGPGGGFKEEKMTFDDDDRLSFRVIGFTLILIAVAILIGMLIFGAPK